MPSLSYSSPIGESVSGRNKPPLHTSSSARKPSVLKNANGLTAKPSNTVTLKQNYSTSMQLPTHSADASPKHHSPLPRTKAKSPLSPPNISRTRVTSNKKSRREFWNSKMVSTLHQIYTQKSHEHLKPILTRIGKLHKDQPSYLCPAAANRPTSIVSPRLPGA